jgi:hypothetical protein
MALSKNGAHVYNPIDIKLIGYLKWDPFLDFF